MSKKQFENFIIRWNNQFPLDRWYRKKYNIAFNSPQHQEVNQIDVYLEFLEEKIFKNHQKLLEKRKKENDEYLTGNWLKNGIDQQFEQMNEQEEFELFDKINIKQIQKQQLTSEDKS